MRRGHRQAQRRSRLANGAHREKAGGIKDELEAVICDVDPELVINNILVRVKSGQKIQDFHAQDWIEVFGLSEDEIIWDNLRSGLEIVFAHDENAEKVSSEIVSGMKEVRRLYECFRAGEISEVDFLYESEWVCLDAVVKILASYLGGAPINIEVLGIVINDEVLSMRYTAVKNRIRGEWDSALKCYEEEQRSHNELLEKRYATHFAGFGDRKEGKRPWRSPSSSPYSTTNSTCFGLS